MDELTLLRELDADAPPPEPRALYAARSRLRHEIAYERSRQRPSQASRMLLAAVATAAAIAVGAMILGGREEPARGLPQVQLTAAGDWLGAAARDAAAEAGVPGAVPRHDQFLYRRDVVDVAGRRYVDESWLPVSGEGVTRTSELGRSWDSPAGWMPVGYDFLRRLPTDPAQLVVYARMWPEDGRTQLAPMTEDDYLSSYTALMGLLRADPPMPAGLRGAIFAALARIPGVEMTDGEVDARGRRGVGFTGPRPRFPVDIIDPATYEYLGQRDGRRLRSSVVERAVVDRLGQRP